MIDNTMKKQILALLINNQTMTFEQLTTMIDADLRVVLTELEQLTEMGLIEEVSPSVYQSLVSSIEEIFMDTSSKTLDDVETNDEIQEFPDQMIALIKANDETFEYQKRNKLVNRRIIIRVLGFVLCSVIYIICQALSKFPQSGGEINQSGVTDLPKYYMYFNYLFCIIALLLVMITLIKKRDILKLKVRELIYEILDWIIILPICIAISTFCFTFVFTYVTVDGNSMNPTIEHSEQLFILNTNNYERFDVVVIHIIPQRYLGLNRDTLYIKRIIGLPGETVKYIFSDNKTILYIKKLGEEEFVKIDEYFYSGVTNENYITTNNKPYNNDQFDFNTLCRIKDGQCDDYNGNLYIPEGYYFVLGDNRGVSNDSRAIGLVYEEDILGTVKYRVNNIFSYRKFV